MNQLYVLHVLIRERAKREREREERDAKRQNEIRYEVQEYKSRKNWENMTVYLNKTDQPNYIRFGSNREIPLYTVIVSPQKQKLFGLGARNIEGHEDALVFRAGGRKYFLSGIGGLVEALRDTDVKVMNQPYTPSGGGGKKKRRKYSKKYTKRRKSKRKSKTKRRR